MGVLRLPRLRETSALGEEGRPSSSTSLKGAAMRSKRLLVALSLRMFFASISRSLRFLSLLFSLRPSFSINKAHQPAKASQRWARTFSMTLSTSTPALRIRSNVSFSKSVVNGRGRANFRIACCCGACSDRKGFVRISAIPGRRSGLFDKSWLTRDLASCGKVSGKFGSLERILCFVIMSSSSSKGSSPVSSA